MDTPNYRMPFVPSTLMTEGGSIETCDMGESIAHNIMLLITTKKAKTDTMKITETTSGTLNSITDYKRSLGSRFH
jgi:hypothetical protein